MPNKINPDLLRELESGCDRRAAWSRDWDPPRLHPTELLRRGIYAGLSQKQREDGGELAGETVTELCANRGIDSRLVHNLYDIGCHHACLADIVTTHLRSVWRGVGAIPKPQAVSEVLWHSQSLRDPSGTLRRVVLVDGWDDDRKAQESHGWHTLGDMAVFREQVKLSVIVLGASRSGKRHSAWAKGFLHPQNRQLRFEKKHDKHKPFGESWIQAWREDYAQIDRETWLSTMEHEGVFRDLSLEFTVDLPSPARLDRVLDILKRKTERLYQISGEFPDPSYSVCDWPRPCPMKCCCYGPEETHPREEGFLKRRHP